MLALAAGRVVVVQQDLTVTVLLAAILLGEEGVEAVERMAARQALQILATLDRTGATVARELAVELLGVLSLCLAAAAGAKVAITPTVAAVWEQWITYGHRLGTRNNRVLEVEAAAAVMQKQTQRAMAVPAAGVVPTVGDRGMQVMVPTIRPWPIQAGMELS
jgi:hypothetical protein